MLKETYVGTLYQLFNPSEKRTLVSLFFIMITLAALELIGVGSLFPYIKILGQQNLIHENTYINATYRMLRFSDDNHFLIFLGCLIFFMVLLRGAFTLLNSYVQARFTSRMRDRLSKECLEHYMRQEYREMYSNNTSIMTKHLMMEVPNTVSAMKQVLILVTNAFLACALITLMIWTDPLLILSAVGILATTVIIIFRLSKAKISKIAHETERCNRGVFKAVAEALSGIKDIKVYGAEIYFLNAFMQPLRRFTRLSVFFSVLSDFPGIFLNVLAFGVLLMIVLYLLFTRGDLISILPVLAIIAISIQRMLPAVTAIYNAFGLIKQYEPGVRIVLDAVKKYAKPKVAKNVSSVTEELTFCSFLKLQAVSFSYPFVSKMALDNVSLVINKNTSVGIVGVSGAGKSTLVDVLLGLLPVSSGEIYCDQVKITEQNRAALSRLVGYVPQQTYLLDTTILENIAFGIPREQINFGSVNRALQIAQLSDFIQQLPEGMETHIGEKGIKLSGGQRQRIGIARALYHDPDILIMDEATNALDSSTENEFNESLKKLADKKTLIIIAHRLSSLSFCDQLILLDQGKIVASGPYEHLAKSSTAFQELYRIGENGW